MANTKESGLNKESLASTGKNLLAAGVGVVMGASIPAKVSGLGAVATILAGIHFKQEWAVNLGTGMLFAVPVNLTKQATAPATDTGLGKLDVKAELTQSTERAKFFVQEFGKKFFLDKVFKPKTKAEGNTLLSTGGEAGNDLGFLGSTPEQTLSQINQSLVASAMDYRGNAGFPAARTMEFQPSQPVNLDQIEANASHSAEGFAGVDFSAM